MILLAEKIFVPPLRHIFSTLKICWIIDRTLKTLRWYKFQSDAFLFNVNLHIGVIFIMNYCHDEMYTSKFHSVGMLMMSDHYLNHTDYCFLPIIPIRKFNCFLSFEMGYDLAFHNTHVWYFNCIRQNWYFFNSDVLKVPSFIFFFPEKYERLQICRTMCCKKCVGKWDVTFNERNPISQFDSCILAHWSLCFIYFVIPIIHWSLSLWSLWSLWSTDAYHFWSLWVILMVC